MKYLSCFLLLLCLTSIASAEKTAIPRDRQEQIIQDYLYATGHAAQVSPATVLSMTQAGEAHAPIKCGMSAIADFVLNRSRLDHDLQVALGVDTLQARPDLPLEYLSPSGHFKVHYTTTGTDAVYQASKDSDGDGVPDYVESTAIIADSVWEHIVTDLGYPAPPRDGFYPEGGDDRYDIYIHDLPGAYYGASYIDSVDIDGPGGHRATSFLELDNDYRLLDAYKDRPLDAIRVTAAHEFFHAVQFGIDYTEAEDYDQPLARRYWMEMSAVWMEEDMYDRINDYYGYLPAFFDDPTRSLQQFDGAFDLHPYGSAVFAIFLANQFGKDVIRETWLRCGEYGRGPHFLVALDHVLDSISLHTEDISSAFARFAEWNYFTGSRAGQGPGNIGYEEAANYPAIPDTAMAVYRDLDTLVLPSEALAPQHMAATYIKLVGELAIQDRIWAEGASVSPENVCALRFDSTLFAAGTPDSLKDSTEIPLTLVKSQCPDYKENPVSCALHEGCSDTIRAVIDSVLSMDMQFDSLSKPWWVISVGRLAQIPDSNEVEADPVFSPVFGTVAALPIYQPQRLFSETIILSAASTDLTRYDPRHRLFLAYLMDERRDTAGFVNKPASVLQAFPNPARLSKMTSPSIKIRFQIPTNQSSALPCQDAFMVVDFYTLAGERVVTVEQTPVPVLAEFGRSLSQEISWNACNSSGEQVASGAYLGIARLYCDRSRKELLAESTVKVAVIR